MSVQIGHKTKTQLHRNLEGEMIFQTLRDTTSTSPMIHFYGALQKCCCLDALTVPTSALRLWQMRVSSLTRRQSTEKGRPLNACWMEKSSSTLPVMNRYRISFRGKPFCAGRCLWSHFGFVCPSLHRSAQPCKVLPCCPCPLISSVISPQIIVFESWFEKKRK